METEQLFIALRGRNILSSRAERETRTRSSCLSFLAGCAKVTRTLFRAVIFTRDRLNDFATRFAPLINCAIFLTAGNQFNRRLGLREQKSRRCLKIRLENRNFYLQLKSFFYILKIIFLVEDYS